VKLICRQKSAVTIQKPITVPLERGMLRFVGERAGFFRVDSIASSS
jgi:hypothetical protein